MTIQQQNFGHVRKQLVNQEFKLNERTLSKSKSQILRSQHLYKSTKAKNIIGSRYYYKEVLNQCLINYDHNIMIVINPVYRLLLLIIKVYLGNQNIKLAMSTPAKVTFEKHLSVAEQLESGNLQKESILQQSNLQIRIGLDHLPFIQSQNLQQTQIEGLVDYQPLHILDQLGTIERRYKKQCKSGLPLKYRKMLKNLKMQKSSQLCAICIMPFLPCNHILHRDCVKPWLKLDHRCPVCRFDLKSYFQNHNQNLKLKLPLNRIDNPEQ